MRPYDFLKNPILLELFETEPKVRRFLDKIRTWPTFDCWLWSGYCDPEGYGRSTTLSSGQKVHFAVHRLMLAAKLNRPLAKIACACHTCDTPACCNPEHLVAADVRWNNTDRAIKGRSATRFSDSEVRVMRQLHLAGVSTHGLAKLYQTSTSTTWRIVNNVSREYAK